MLRRSPAVMVVRAALLCLSLVLVSLVTSTATPSAYAASAVSVSISAPNVGSGSATTVSGAVVSGGVGVSNAKVVLQARPAGQAWATVATGVTGAGGAYSFRYTVYTNTEFRVGHPADAAYSYGVSPIKTVYALKWISMLVGVPSQVVAGQKFVVEGFASHAVHGEYAVLQYKPQNSYYRTIARGIVQSNGYFNIPVTSGLYVGPNATFKLVAGDASSGFVSKYLGARHVYGWFSVHDLGRVSYEHDGWSTTADYIGTRPYTNLMTNDIFWTGEDYAEASEWATNGRCAAVYFTTYGQLGSSRETNATSGFALYANGQQLWADSATMYTVRAAKRINLPGGTLRVTFKDWADLDDVTNAWANPRFLCFSTWE